ncbi:PASTA domain-containing protein [Streptomyces sp. NPDC001373]|uniref:Stk1 family PASTA domain-containing Ser/Thr kinase n=1 Tax=Streptomyces sp. NPDC001373 TaxID=3364565 RepID=UPI00368B91AA
MRRRHTITLFTAATALALTACNPQASGSNGKPAAPDAPSQKASSPSAPAAAAKTGTLPNLVGKGLQSAQDEAQAAGFHALKSHDALGRDRLQALDRNWKVCSQTPAGGGTVDTGTTIDLGAVKLEETCPATDAPAPKPAGDTMPDFVGQGMKAVRAALPSNASISVKDAVQSRMVLQESNWKVCTQDPAAGAALNGRPVSFTVAKIEEACP